MLEDRDYMRQPEFDDSRWTLRFHPRWSWTLALLLAYAVVFVAEILVSPAPRLLIPGNAFCNEYFALSRQGIERGFVWQLVTYQFMHAGFLHLLFNSWAIFAFGRELESSLGGRRFLALVFASGMIGGVFQVATALLWPGLFGGAVVGASACAFGLVAAFAMIYPERELTLLVFFVIPVQMRAKTLLIFSAVLAVAGIIFSESIFGGNVANAAHLGGMVMGWFFVRKILPGRWSWLTGYLHPSEWSWRKGLLHPSEKSAPRLPRSESAEDPTADSIVEDEVDPILDKISAHGIQSLTARERAVLEAARKKIAQR